MPRFITHGPLGRCRVRVNNGAQSEEHGQRGRGRGHFCGQSCGRGQNCGCGRGHGREKIVDVLDMEGRLELLSKAREELLVKLIVQEVKGS